MGDSFWNDAYTAPMSEQEVEEFSEEFGLENQEDHETYLSFGFPEMSAASTDDMQEWLQEKLIPYIIQVEGKYEFSPEMFFWRPGMEKPGHRSTNPDFDVTVTIDEALTLSQAQLRSLLVPFAYDELGLIRENPDYQPRTPGEVI